MVIAIDGPAGAGKSTVARAVARELGFTYLDTGAMYRAVGAGRDASPASRAAEVAERIGIEVGDRVLIDGRDVTDAIRTPRGLRGRLARRRRPRRARRAGRQAAGAHAPTATGSPRAATSRTVVAPDAEVKVFLTADPAERAAPPRRRARRRPATRSGASRRLRDERDASEDRSVHEPAPDAVPVDTTGLSIDEVVGQIVTLAVEAREIA